MHLIIRKLWVVALSHAANCSSVILSIVCPNPVASCRSRLYESKPIHIIRYRPFAAQITQRYEHGMGLRSYNRL